MLEGVQLGEGEQAKLTKQVGCQHVAREIIDFVSVAEAQIDFNSVRYWPEPRDEDAARRGTM